MYNVFDVLQAWKLYLKQKMGATLPPLGNSWYLRRLPKYTCCHYGHSFVIRMCENIIIKHY